MNTDELLTAELLRFYETAEKQRREVLAVEARRIEEEHRKAEEIRNEQIVVLARFLECTFEKESGSAAVGYSLARCAKFALDPKDYRWSRSVTLYPPRAAAIRLSLRYDFSTGEGAREGDYVVCTDPRTKESDGKFDLEVDWHFGGSKVEVSSLIEAIGVAREVWPEAEAVLERERAAYRKYLEREGF